MSHGASAWVGERVPEPPEDLRTAIAAAVDAAAVDAAVIGETGGPASAPAAQLARAARARLDAARARPGRVRESAFELLVADGLVTYACEAALESDDPDAALTAILEMSES